MTTIQGNRGVFGDSASIGYSPEVTDGVFRLYLVLSDGSGTNKLLIHEHTLEAPVAYHDLLAGHAREMMLEHLKSGSEMLNAHAITREIESLAARLQKSDMPALERKILESPEGTPFEITSWGHKGPDNPTLHYRRHTAYMGWLNIINGTIPTAVLSRYVSSGREYIAKNEKSQKNYDLDFEDELEWYDDDEFVPEGY